MFLKYQVLMTFITFIIISLPSWGLDSKCFSDSDNITQIQNSNAKYYQLYKLNKNSFFLEIKNAVKSKPQRFYFGKKARVFLCQDVHHISSVINKFAGVSTTHVAAFDILNVTSQMVAFSNIKFVHSKKFQNLVSNNKIIELNFPINKEKLIDSKAKYIFSYATQTPSIDGLDQLSLFGIQPVFISEFRESEVLGRAEWIKVIGLFFGKYSLAKAHFDKVRKNYLLLKERISKKIIKPTVIMGKLQSNHWNAPAKHSYFATLVKDAGANYYFSNWKNLHPVSVSFERIIGDKRSVDYWLPHTMWRGTKDILLEDKRYKLLSFFENGKIYNNTKRVNKFSGNDFWESAVMSPDLLLKDLVGIFYSDNSKSIGNDLKWYEEL